MDGRDSDDANIDIVCENLANEYFDKVIGHIEDIVLSEKFQEMHLRFLEKYWSTFEQSEENKLVYMEIFKEYTDTFDTFFIEELKKRMDNFDMGKFAEQLSQHLSLQNSFEFSDSEIFELLHSFSNFQIFKTIMLDYRRKKEGLVEHLDLNILKTIPLRPITEASPNDETTCATKNYQ